MQLIGFLFSWRMAEGRRNGEVEEKPQGASLEKVLPESAVNLHSSSGCKELGFAVEFIGFQI